MTPAQPPFPTAWNLPFHPFAGNHTSTLMSESAVGLIVTTTRQNSGSSLYGLAPVPPPCRSPGAENCPAGMTCAIVMAVSFNTSFDKLSHEEPNAGAAEMHARKDNVHLMVRIFIGASGWQEVYIDCSGNRPRQAELSIVAKSNAGSRSRFKHW